MAQTTEAASPAAAGAVAPWRRHGRRLAALSCLLCCVCAVLQALLPGRHFNAAAVVFLYLYIVCDPGNVRRSQALIALALAAIGLGVAAIRGVAADILWQGSRSTLVFMLLFASVTLLQYPATHSPAMAVVRRLIGGLSPGRRYLWLTLASHFLSAVTNFAGFSLLSSFMVGNRDPDVNRRLSLALTRGFTIASCWSPFYLGMAVVVSVMPHLRWIDIAAPGLLLGVALTLLGFAMDRLETRRASAMVELDEPTSPPVPAAERRAGLFRIVALSVGLVVAVAAFNAITGVQMAATIAIVVAIFSLVWLVALRLRGVTGADGKLLGPRQYGATLSENVAALRGIAVLFIGANMFGQGIASALDGHMLVDAAGAIGISGVLWVPFLLCVIAAGSALGLHSVILIVVFGHTLPIAALGISESTLALVFLTSWGIGGVLSPLSNITLYVAQLLGISSWTFAWRDNGPFCVASIVVASAIIMSFQWLTGGA
ncbi:MAG: hypothetical protein ABI439_00180 [Rhodospirillales bacterium]